MMSPVSRWKQQVYADVRSQLVTELMQPRLETPTINKDEGVIPTNKFDLFSQPSDARSIAGCSPSKIYAHPWRA